MNRSEVLYHIIALAILSVVILLVWSYTTEVSNVDGKTNVDESAIEAAITIYADLYRMVPILCGALLFSIVISFYLEEWLHKTTWQYRIMERIIAILSCVPSLVYGLFAAFLIIFHSLEVSFLFLLVVVMLLVIPVTIRSMQHAIQAVDISIREAAYALGANRWRVVTGHLLPHTLPAILVSICTAIARVFAVAAMIIVAGMLRSSSNIDEVQNSIVVLLSTSVILSIFSSFLEIKR